MGDPWAGIGDGNPRTTDPQTGQPTSPETLKCCKEGKTQRTVVILSSVLLVN
jgi:hypothetical protein